MTTDLPGLSQVAAALWRRYGTPAKLANARALIGQTDACDEIIRAYPWRVTVEPMNMCNLWCAGCPTHRSALPKGKLDPKVLDHVLRDLWPYLVQVNLFNWGEPFLHPDLPVLIRTIHDRQIGTQVHSNFNRMPDGWAERVIRSGLDFLIASIDGATQDVYAQYRAGGSCEQALRNLAAFVETRDRLGASTPRIVWRFLCFPHNLDEIDLAEQRARRIGVDDFVAAPGFLNGRVWTREGPRDPFPTTEDRTPPYCRDLFDFPVIHWDGTVLPCCFASDPRYVWGDLKTQSWGEVFNGEAYRTARRLAAGDTTVTGPCASCGRIGAPATAAAT
jgi:MoaA/NifB/PqqE/SkfB family radical SAM enzyme